MAACIQIVGPIVRACWWKGNVETTEEWLCLIKSKRDLYDEIGKAIKEMPTYKIPEIIAIPIVAGSKDYLEWLSNEL